MARLELRNLRKRFGSASALESIDLEVGSGEFVSLLGPSGCGKTTTLRIIAGFERPDTGAVLLDGKDITHQPAAKRNMGMVFQAYSLFPNMTAQGNVEFGLRVRRMPQQQRADKSAELLELVGLAQVSHHFPHQLSGGQQQRVALARALAIEPQVLLLDEPLSALDARVRLQLRREIRRIQTQLGITTVYVTHDQEEALSISDRVAVMSQGRLEQLGNPIEVYSNPANAFVAEFVGTMNCLSGRVERGHEGTIRCGSVRIPTESDLAKVADTEVLVLVRPEAVVVDPLSDGSIIPEGAVEGRVLTQTFLGPVTRLAITTPLGELMSDVASSKAATLGPGAVVAVQMDPSGLLIITN